MQLEKVFADIPEFYSQSPFGRRREAASASCSLTPPHGHEVMGPTPQINKQVKSNKKKKRCYVKRLCVGVICLSPLSHPPCISPEVPHPDDTHTWLSRSGMWGAVCPVCCSQARLPTGAPSDDGTCLPPSGVCGCR